jgi:hypothetical protein
LIAALVSASRRTFAAASSPSPTTITTRPSTGWNAGKMLNLRLGADIGRSIEARDQTRGISA